MANIETFRITEDNNTRVKEVCKTRGDKSKLYNDALNQYFLNQNTPQEKQQEPTKKRAVVEI